MVVCRECDVVIVIDATSNGVPGESRGNNDGRMMWSVVKSLKVNLKNLLVNTLRLIGITN